MTLRHLASAVLVLQLVLPVSAEATPPMLPEQFAVASFLSLNPETGKNQLVAPFGTAKMLALLKAGAAGNTAQQLDISLGYGAVGDGDALKTLGDTSRAIEAAGKAVPGKCCELLHGAGIWVQKGGAPLKPEYSAAVAAFGAKPVELDFAAKAATPINAWAADLTAKRFKKMVTDAELKGASLVTTSATVFKGDWREPFAARDTKTESFTLEGGKKVPVKMMHLRATLPFGQGEGFDPMQAAVELPFANPDWALVLVLPRTDLVRVARRLVSKSEGVFSHRWPKNVDVYLPRFTIETTQRLEGAMNAMGAGLAIGPQADFSGISATKGLSVSRIFQTARFAVDEKGSDAVAVSPKGSDKIPPVASGAVPFRADRPFLYFLRHRPTQTTVLMGWVADPRK